MHIKSKILNYIHAYARPLEKAQFNYLFNHGSEDAYIHALQEFQTSSGGFANGLEPDTQNPNPSAIQTWTAIHYMMDMDLPNNHQMIQQTMTYLENQIDKANLFETVIQSNNNYPHAIWWHYEKDTSTWGYNPSVALWAFMYRINKNQKAKAKLDHAFQDFLSEPKTEMHELKCFVDAYEWLYDLKEDFDAFQAFEIKLYQTVEDLIKDFQTRDKNVYGPSPMTFCDHPQTHIYKMLKPHIDMQLVDVVSYIENNEIWDISFSWGQYEDVFKTIKPYWQCITAIKNYRFIHE